MTELVTDLVRPRGRYGVDGNYGLIPAPVVFAGYLLGAGLMVAAAAIAWRYAIAAERRTLESVARPLAFVE